jgi:hypothetical protein
MLVSLRGAARALSRPARGLRAITSDLKAQDPPKHVIGMPGKEPVPSSAATELHNPDEGVT